MKQLQQLIREFSTPDHISGEVSYKGRKRSLNTSFYSQKAHAFVYNLYNEKIAMAFDSGDYHCDIFRKNIDDCEKKTGIGKQQYPGRIYDKKNDEEKDYWENNPDMKNLRLGRLWDLRQDRDNCYSIILSWWEELDPKDLVNASLNVIKYYDTENGDEVYDKIDYEATPIFLTDNNGQLFKVDKRKVHKITKRSESSQELFDTAKAIHLASQKEKREFFKQFREERAKKWEKEHEENPYNKSKTRAEQHQYIKNSDGSYRKYYGDSLENFVKNFVNEGENVIPQEVKDVEWTDMNGFCILKPEFTQYKSDWFSKLNADGWQIIKHKDFQMTPETAAELYAPHKGEDFYNDLVKYMSSGPCCCVMCKKNTKKPIDAMNVLKDEIRAEWGIDKMKNAMHSSDSLRNVEREANIIFNK